MISRLEFSGWLDQIRSKSGWSDKIGTAKWMVLQALVPMPFIAIVLLGFSAWFDLGAMRIAIFSSVFPAIAAAFSGERWDNDQKALSR